MSNSKVVRIYLFMLLDSIQLSFCPQFGQKFAPSFFAPQFGQKLGFLLPSEEDEDAGAEVCCPAAGLGFGL